MLDELGTDTVKWKVDGNQIIIMGNINAYVESKLIKDIFDLLGMREIIIERHINTEPATTRGDKPGKAIYMVWGTRGVNIITGD